MRHRVFGRKLNRDSEHRRAMLRNQAAGLFEHEKRFWRPSAVETSDDGLVLIADSCRHRIQIYSRVPALATV